MQDTSCLVLSIPAHAFFSRRFSRVRSATTSFKAGPHDEGPSPRRTSPRGPCRPPTGACRPPGTPSTSRNTSKAAIPSWRQSSEMFSSPRCPSSTMRIFSMMQINGDCVRLSIGSLRCGVFLVTTASALTYRPSLCSVALYIARQATIVVFFSSAPLDARCHM